jgi:hypothetical protein
VPLFVDITPGYLPPIVMPQSVKKVTIWEQFIAFHQANPHIYSTLRSMALKMRREGISHYGMKGLFEVLRWQYALQTKGDPYKLNNNYTALYARLLMEQEPELHGFFETRRRR